MPVRRRDIPLIRRAEEGTGESLRLSYSILTGPSSSSFQGQYTQVLFDEEPASSSSSLKGRNLRLQTARANGSSNHQELNRNVDRNNTSEDHAEEFAPKQSEFQFARAESGVLTPTFASLRTSFDSPKPLSVPDSPCFSSLVSLVPKRKLTFDAPENSSPKKRSTASSAGSQLSVELQLTQSPKDDDEDADDADEEDDDDDDDSTDRPALDASSNPDDDPSGQGAEPSAEMATAAIAGSGQEFYKGELRWGLSQPEEPWQTHNPSEQGSLTQESDSNRADLELLTQPPSQLNHANFPIHHHTPSNPSSVDPNSSASLHLSTAKLASPVFASSTPQKQTWYAPAVKRTRSNTKVSAETPKSSPAKSERPAHMRYTRSTSKTRVFKSGTLHLTPAKATNPNPEPISEEHASQDYPNNQESQQSTDSSLSFPDSYPPLLTQAPCGSQSMSQS
ncbi:hypothetical protein CPC08DRAFT_718472 [Agrocybe pediades]|nr:hypothetical protein CPC08DRAFT_718472 [Agrocybe pediades]